MRDYSAFKKRQEEYNANMQKALEEVPNKATRRIKCSFLQIRARKVKWYAFGKRRRHKATIAYYEAQLALLANFIEDSRIVEEGEEGALALEELDATAVRQRRMDAVLAKVSLRLRESEYEQTYQVTLCLNVFLLAAKLTAALLSNSLSVLSTVIDSAVDITSGFVVW